MAKSQGTQMSVQEVKKLQDQINSLNDLVASMQDQLESVKEPKLEELKESPKENDFAREVWKAVLIGATSALFDPRRISMDNRENALDKYLQRALKTAEEAAKTARNYEKYLQARLEEQDRKEANDPLKSLISSPPQP